MAFSGTDLHMSRFVRHAGGMSIEDIAESDGVSISRVQQSIKTVQAYRQMCTVEEANVAVVDIVLSAAEAQKRSILLALNATKSVKRGNRYVQEPDWDVRRWAMGEWRMLVETSKPKAGNQSSLSIGVAVNQQQQTPVSTPSDGPESFEDVLRRVKKLPPPNTMEQKPPLLEGGEVSSPDAD